MPEDFGTASVQLSEEGQPHVRDLNSSNDRSASSEHPSESMLAGYLDGELADVEVAAMESHLDMCGDCREMLASAAAVLAAGRSAVGATLDEVASAVVSLPRDRTVAPIRRAPRRVWRVVGLAIAASVAAVLVARNSGDGSRDPRAMVRTPGPAGQVGEGLPAIAVYFPTNGASVTRAGLRFTWSASASERFHFVLADEEGSPIYAGDTPDSSLVLPDSVALQAGRLYFWHADAISGGLAASTRLQHFSVVAVP